MKCHTDLQCEVGIQFAKGYIMYRHKRCLAFCSLQNDDPGQNQMCSNYYQDINALFKIVASPVNTHPLDRCVVRGAGLRAKVLFRERLMESKLSLNFLFAEFYDTQTPAMLFSIKTSAELLKLCRSSGTSQTRVMKKQP